MDQGADSRTAPTTPSAIGTAAATANQGTPTFLLHDEHNTDISGPSMHFRQMLMAGWLQYGHGTMR
jgi:hypothetical protein